MKILANTIKIKDNRSTYPRGKGASGVHQQIINLIPPHVTYHELHLGGGSIMKHKLPASVNFGIDIDPKVIKAWSDSLGISSKMLIGSELEALSPEIKIDPGQIQNNDTAASSKISIGSGTTSPEIPIHDRNLSRDISPKNKNCNSLGVSPKISFSKNKAAFIFKNEDASSYLKNNPFTNQDFIYSDPPYVMKTRKGGKIYDFEYDDQDHIELLTVLKTLPCMVMVSGYYSELYMEILQGWNTHSFQAQTRQGTATEWVWFNYPVPTELHDYSYLGDTFRERERIKKKKDRWVARLLKTPVLERNAILQAMTEIE